MSKHTPGPWEAYYVGCGDWDLKGPVTREDWTLAAAAPDLLDALKLAAEINPYGSVENAAARDAARAAIAKARGEA